MKFYKFSSLGIILLASCFLASNPVWAHKDSSPQKQKANYFIKLPTGEGVQRKYFTNSELLTQNEEVVRFYDDVLKDKVVLISFIYTHCKNACPLNSQTFSVIQNLLADQMESRVRLVSISVDPTRDTPAALREFSERFTPGQGWKFLTGEKQNIVSVMRKLGPYNPDFEGHSPVFVMGNVKTGHWRRMRGNVSPENIVKFLWALLEKE
jgi:protein SCO1/2